MSYVISDYNVLVHSVLPSLPPGLHPFLLISLHFRAQRAPTPHLAVCVSLSRLHFQHSPPHPALFCSCLSGFCITVLLSHSCVEVFSVLFFFTSVLFSSALHAAVLYALFLLFCFVLHCSSVSFCKCFCLGLCLFEATKCVPRRPTACFISLWNINMLPIVCICDTCKLRLFLFLLI